MADQEYEKLKSQIQDLKKRLSELVDDPVQTKEIGDLLQRLKSKASSYAERLDLVASSAPASPSQAVVNDPYMQGEGEGEDDEAVNVAESAAAAASQKAKSEKYELSEKARENLLQVLQAPNVGPQILPSGKPGVDYAQQTMIHQLQTTLAPAFILERLEKKPTPTSQSKPGENVEPQKPKPQAEKKIKVTFPKHVEEKKGEGVGEGVDVGEVIPGVSVIDGRNKDLVNRVGIFERLRTDLQVYIPKASDYTKPKSERSKLSPKHSFIPDSAAVEADTSLLTRQIIIIRKLPSRIFLVEDVSLTMGAVAAPASASTDPSKLGVASSVGAVASSKRLTEKPIWGLVSEEIEKMEIKGELVGNRLPRRPLPSVSASHYYMNNRQKFVNFINELFLTYHDEISSKKEQISCDPAANAEFSLLTHQKIVRDYLNIYTPYRGLLLYHGLGSG